MNIQLNRPELTEEYLRRHVPSIYAGGPIQGVSQDYEFIPTNTVINALKGEGWVPVFADQSRVGGQRLTNTPKPSREGLQKHMVRFRRADTPNEAGDYVTELVLTNSHDRTSAYNLKAGIYRVLCSNGLVVPDATLAGYRVKHTGHAIAEVLAASQTIASKLPILEQHIDEFRHTPMSPERQFEFAQAALFLRYPNYNDNGAPITERTLLLPQRPQDEGDDIWTVLNRVQENLLNRRYDQGARSFKTGRRFGVQRQLRSIDRVVQLNTGIWVLAERALRGEQILVEPDEPAPLVVLPEQSPEVITNN